jgi:hypothetical protein
MRRMNNKGQVLDMVGGMVLGVMVLIFLVFAVLYGIGVLNPSSFLTGTSAAASTDLTQNLSSGITSFAGQIPTVFKILAVVLALSAIVILIVYVRRMQGGGMQSGGL